MRRPSTAVACLAPSTVAGSRALTASETSTDQQHRARLRLRFRRAYGTRGLGGSDAPQAVPARPGCSVWRANDRIDPLRDPSLRFDSLEGGVGGHASELLQPLAVQVGQIAGLALARMEDSVQHLRAPKARHPNSVVAEASGTGESHGGAVSAAP